MVRFLDMIKKMDEMLFYGGYEKKMKMKFSCLFFRFKGEFNCFCFSV